MKLKGTLKISASEAAGHWITHVKVHFLIGKKKEDFFLQ